MIWHLESMWALLSSFEVLDSYIVHILFFSNFVFQKPGDEEKANTVL